jgi:hypothetical protein
MYIIPDTNNTCYINVLLRLLSNIKITNYLANNYENEIYKCIRELIKYNKKNEIVYINVYEKYIVNILKILELKKGEENDCEETLSKIFGLIHKLLKNNKENVVDERYKDKFAYFTYLEKFTLVFGEESIICMKCKKRTLKYNVDYFLRLYVTERLRCIKSLIENKYKENIVDSICDNCNYSKKILKENIVRLPHTLFIRFISQCRRYNVKLYETIKINDNVYKLIFLIVHIPINQTSGHYISYYKHEETWIISDGINKPRECSIECIDNIYMSVYELKK